MTEPKRLFDCLDFLLQKGEIHDLFAAKENGEWKWVQAQIGKVTRENLAGEEPIVRKYDYRK